jgi:hypothetical protein
MPPRKALSTYKNCQSVPAVREIESRLSGEDLSAATVKTLKDSFYLRRRAKLGYGRLAYEEKSFRNLPAVSPGMMVEAQLKYGTAVPMNCGTAAMAYSSDSSPSWSFPNERVPSANATASSTASSSAASAAKVNHSRSQSNHTEAEERADATAAAETEAEAKEEVGPVSLDDLRKSVLDLIVTEVCDLSLTPPISRIDRVWREKDVIQYWEAGVFATFNCPVDAEDAKREYIDLSELEGVFVPGMRFWKGILLPADVFEDVRYDDTFREMIFELYHSEKPGSRRWFQAIADVVGDATATATTTGSGSGSGYGGSGGKKENALLERTIVHRGRRGHKVAKRVNSSLQTGETANRTKDLFKMAAARKGDKVNPFEDEWSLEQVY